MHVDPSRVRRIQRDGVHHIRARRAVGPGKSDPNIVLGSHRHDDVGSRATNDQTSYHAGNAQQELGAAVTPGRWQDGMYRGEHRLQLRRQALCFTHAPRELGPSLQR
jgi:hypothetical protein